MIRRASAEQWAGLPPGLTLPAGIALATYSPDGPPGPALIGRFLVQALAGPKMRVPASPARREMDAGEVVARLGGGARVAGTAGSGGAALD